jgi:hypothetical protein
MPRSGQDRPTKSQLSCNEGRMQIVRESWGLQRTECAYELFSGDTRRVQRAHRVIHCSGWQLVAPALATHRVADKGQLSGADLKDLVD